MTSVGWHGGPARPARRLPAPTRLIAAAVPSGVPLVRALVGSALARVFGPPPFDPHTEPGDPGLFGPGSASWRIIGDPAAIVGGLRALVVQLLHPLAVAGVADHSRFRTDPLGRLHATSAYVTVTTFGSTAEALDVAGDVREAHRHVRGVAPDGRAYDAASPELLAWVSVALTSSFLAADRAYSPAPADGDARNAFVAEQSRAAALLDRRVDLVALRADPAAREQLRTGTLDLPLLAEGHVPTTEAGLDEAVKAYAGELALTLQSREALRFLLWPDLAAPIKAGYLPVLAGALAIVDEPHRRLLGLPTGKATTWPFVAQTRALLAGLRLIIGASPSRRTAEARAAGTS